MRFSRFEPRGRLKQQIRFQTTFLSTSHHGNQTKAAHRHIHVGSTAGTTTIRSGGDTTLKGAQLIGKGIQADTRNLHIESVQDSETYQSKQQNAGSKQRQAIEVDDEGQVSGQTTPSKDKDARWTKKNGLRSLQNSPKSPKFPPQDI